MFNKASPVQTTVNNQGAAALHTGNQKRVMHSGRGAFNSKRPIVRSVSTPNKFALLNVSHVNANRRLY